jgi:hypothetical protein
VLREGLDAGADRVAPGRTDLDVTGGFAPLLGWVVSWWRGTAVARAVDAPSLGERRVGLRVSVLDRGCASPVAWPVMPAGQPGAWMAAILARLDRLAPAGPAGGTVLGLSDRGLWSPRRFDRVAARGWPPLLRRQGSVTFRPAGHRPRVSARSLVPGPGHAWVGAGGAVKDRPDRRAGTLRVVWDRGAAAPWLLLTRLPPAAVDGCWYGLRAGIELGFRALKGVGWPWARTRRTDPARVARPWWVLAVATLWVLAYGTRAADAARVGVAPARLRVAPPPPPREYQRWLSVCGRGSGQWRGQLLRARRLWAQVWRAPEAWPEPPPDLIIGRVLTPLEATYV